MNPYEILGVANDADDDSIRKAYLKLVRLYPPERHPQAFEKINRAYILLRDEKSRMEYYLFNHEPGIGSPFEALLSNFSMGEHRKPPNFKKMKRYLKKCGMM